MTTLERALALIEFSDLARTRYRPQGERKETARKVAHDKLTDESANEVYCALLGRPLLSDEANLLEAVAERLGRSIRWRHLELSIGHSDWKDGRYEAAGGA